MLLRISLLLIAVASEEGKWPGCLEGGIAYTNLLDISDAYEKKRLVQEPNGGYLANAKACQDSCKLAPHCKKFTFKTGSDPPGACFLIDAMDDLTHRYAENDAISGSVSCNFSVVIPSMAAPPGPAGAAAAAADKAGAAGTAAVDAATSAAEGAAATTGEVAATAASTGTAAVDAATSAAEGAAATTGEAAVTAASTGTAAVDAANSASTGAAGTIRAKAQAASPSAKALLFPAGSACMKTNLLLQDSLLPAPVSWTETAEKCQQTCQASKTCTLFSWKADSNPVGGCWLFPERSSPLAQISDPRATSGPKECLSSEDLEQGPGKAFISQEPSGLGSNTLWLILGGVATAAALGGMAAFVSTGSKRKSKRGLAVASGDEEMATPIAPSPMFAPPSARAAPGPTPTYQTPGFQPVVYQRLPLPQQTYQVHQVPQVFYSHVAQ